MSRKFRLTCARTTYFEIEVEVEEGAQAERSFEAALADERLIRETAPPLCKPAYRVVEIVAAEEQAAGDVAHAA